MKKQILKQMQKKVQDQIQGMQEELANQVVEGVSGGGVVKVQATGANEIVSIKIAPEVVNSEEVDVLEDLVLVAVKDALNKAQGLSMEKISQLTGGLNLPGLF